MANHLKRLAASKTWQIPRKTNKYIVSPLPGPHSAGMGMPLGVVLRDLVGYAQSMGEARKIVASGKVNVDGRQRTNLRFPVGIFDTLEFETIQEHFRLILNKQGKISILKITKDESSVKPCKITGKTMLRGKVQLNLYDGKNIPVEKDTYKVGDTVLLSLPGQKISKHLKLDKKSTIFLIGGKHIGETGHVEDIISNKIIYKDHKGDLIETLKKYAFVIGENKPAIKLE